ncbi:MAG: OmpA family protein, partial [Desulfobulbaceae bacterium]|nr:OmpA family protein [Desulfobulbaceae bacterium]
AFRTFGAPVYTSITYGPDDYTKEDLAHAIKEVISADGVSPLDFAIRATGKDWDSEQGKIAVIILSDGVDMDIEPVLAAEELKKQYGENICIYTVLIGNDKNGRKILSDVAQAGECGFAVEGTDLANQAGMSDFVKSVFLMPDSDGDGIADDRDDCPHTPPGLEVDENGCFHAVISGDVLFDFDKYVIKPEAYQILDAIAEILNNNPGIAMEIHGHTDFKGTEKYNDVLSINRAKAGKQYFVNKGINSKRIFIKGFGELQPVAPNQTDEGRALNRRIEFKRVR